MMNERELYDTIAIYLKQRDNERGAIDAATIEVLRVAIEKAIDVLKHLNELP